MDCIRFVTRAQGIEERQMKDQGAGVAAFAMSPGPVLAVVLLAGIVSACGGSPAETEEAPESSFADRLSFENVTEAAGLSAFRHETGAFGLIWFPESMGSGAAFFDYDGDGWQDIALAGGGAGPALEVPPWATRRCFLSGSTGIWAMAPSRR